MSTFSIWGVLRALLQHNKKSALFVPIVWDSHAPATMYSSAGYAGTSRFLLTVAKCPKHNFP